MTFDGRRERATVVVTAGIRAHLRPGVSIVNVSVTTTGALVPGDALFTLPPESRPSSADAPIFGTLVRISDSAAIRVDIQANGQVQTQIAVASGATLRGSFAVPL